MALPLLSSDDTADTVYRALARARADLAERDRAIVGDQIAIAEIPAPTGAEEQRARWVAARLARGPRRVSVDRAGNVIALQPGAADEDPVVVCAHLDTVFPAPTPLAVRRDGNRLTGPGISDNARGLAAMLALADAVDGRRLRTRRPVVFAATTGEEGDGDLRGARHLFATIARSAHAAIAIDGAGDDRIVNSALGCRRLHVSYKGPGGHSWAAYGAPNPVHAVGGLISRLAARIFPVNPRTTLTVSRTGGGTAVNAIPQDGWIDVDIRSTSRTALLRAEREVREAAQAALDEENARRTVAASALHLKIGVTGDRPPGDVPLEEPVVRAAVDATRAIGRTPELAVASTDANVPISLGIPAIAIGAGGRAGDTHTPDEWYENVDGTLGIARALTVVVAAAGLG
jgi:acetylornithine deacetylase/succinyl-diaminopimelate desuccinylase-like protein